MSNYTVSQDSKSLYVNYTETDYSLIGKYFIELYARHSRYNTE